MGLCWRYDDHELKSFHPLSRLSIHELSRRCNGIGDRAMSSLEKLSSVTQRRSVTKSAGRDARSKDEFCDRVKRSQIAADYL